MISKELTGFLLVLLLAVSSLCDEPLAKGEEDPEDDGRKDDVATLLRALKEIVQRRQEKLQLDERANVVRGLTPQLQQQTVDFHNQLRRGEGAADMEKLTWNNRLAAMAQQWSDRCEFVHRDSSPAGTYDAASYGFGNIGENMWVGFGGSSPIPNHPIQSWFDEKNGYVYSSTQCRKEPCGHYTQVVRASTREVGCGFTKCATMKMPGQAPKQNAEFFVCNYGPGDNYPDKQPYKKGQPCTACTSGQFYCSNTLCDSKCSRAGSGGNCECKATCQNCGTVTNTCGCKCIPGYSGVTCDKPCQDLDPKCNPKPGVMGWPASFCSYSDASFRQQVIEKCPKMCKTCVPSDGTPCRNPREMVEEAVLR